MIRTDGTPTICSPDVDLAGLDALREDNVSFLKPVGDDFTVLVDDEFSFATREEAERFAQSLYHLSPRTADASVQYPITDHTAA